MEPYLFEVSSEAGRKIGGIYTVIKSKSRYSSKYFPDRYMFLGFYDERCVHDVKFAPPPPEIAKIFEELAALDIYCHYGNWIYANNTPIILVDAKQFGQRQVQYDDAGHTRHDLQLNYIKFLLWKNFHIDSLMESSYDFSENVVWGWAIGMLLEKLCKISPYKDAPKIAHFHEWICSSGLLYSKLKALPVATVFTTHATVLGRSLSSSGMDILQKAQNSSEQIDLSKAYEQKVEGKHQLEMEAAKKCHVFTTVSETVAQEVRYILGKYPDAILLNGLDFQKQMEEGQVRDISKYVRHELLQLCESAFAPYQDARYDNALLTFTSGRYEYINKGFDIYIQGLAKLNQKIKESGQKNKKQVMAFIFAPSSSRGPKLSVIRNYLLLDKINEVLEATLSNPSKKHYESTKERIEDVKGTFKRDLTIMHSSLIKDGSRPPISLYDLNYANDEIINACHSNGLDNSSENPVKVIFYPTYVQPNDGLLNMGYDDVISGMDMGVFASRYEPFGYTPLEAGLKRSITVSTDSAGFGRYLQSKEDLAGRGVKILPMSSGAQNSADELAKFMHEIYMLEPQELDAKKHDSFNLMHLFDWKDLISNYIKAYDLALERATQKDGEPEEHSLVPQESHALSVISKKVALVAQPLQTETIMGGTASKKKQKSAKKPKAKKKSAKFKSSKPTAKKKSKFAKKSKPKKKFKSKNPQKMKSPKLTTKKLSKLKTKSKTKSKSEKKKSVKTPKKKSTTKEKTKTKKKSKKRK